MRREEAASCVASRIAQFETSTGSQNQLLACDNEKGVVGNVNNNNGYKRGGTPVAFGSGSRYLDLDDIIEESSIGTDDGGELEEEDSDGYLAASNEETTSSPDTSFRLSGRSSSSSDRDSTGENWIYTAAIFGLAKQVIVAFSFAFNFLSLIANIQSIGQLTSFLVLRK